MKSPIIHFKPTNKTDITGQRCVYLQIYIQRRYIRRSTGIWVSKKEWDPISEKIISGANMEEKNRILIDKKHDLEEKFQNYAGKLSYDVVLEIMEQEEKDSGKPNSNDDFIEYAHKVNNLFYGRGKYGYTSWYNKHRYIIAFASFVEKHLKMNRPRICEINLRLFDQYINYRINTRGNKNKEIINKSLVPLYAAVNYAERNGLITSDIAGPITENYMSTRDTHYNPNRINEEQIKYLTREQMKILFDFKKKVNRVTTRNILDMFFFSYFACGLRLSDIITLEWDNVDMERMVIKKVQVKSKKPLEVDIPIAPQGMEILNKWKRKSKNKRFVFARLPSDFDMNNERALFMKRNSQDKTVNTSLQEIARKAGLNVALTMHMARHTFAVQSIKNGVDIYLLSKLLGHGSIITTEKVYAQFLKDDVRNKVVYETL